MATDADGIQGKDKSVAELFSREISASDNAPGSALATLTTFTVEDADCGQRLDAFLSRAAGISRSKARQYIEEGCCRLNDKSCSAPAARLSSGARVEFVPPERVSELTPEVGELAVLYQDEALAVVNKPAGLTVHPCPSCPEGTLVHRLLSHFPKLAQPEISGQEGQRPGIVHRLDKDTSGLLIIALTESVRLAMCEAFADRQVHKTYLALTRGVPAPTGRVDMPLGRHPTLKTRVAVVPESQGGKPALTEWKTLYADPGGRFALLAVTIHTGRTHQIRVHLAQSGYPLWGDKLYAPHDENDPAARQMLHAWKLSFAHPVTGEEQSFICPPPPDFAEAILALSQRLQAVVLTGTPGCGKSSVLRLLQARGVPVWSADAAVAELYAPGGDGWSMLRGRYGERFTPRLSDDPTAPPHTRGDAPVDKAALALAFAENPSLRSEVEHLIHPLVYASLEHFFAEAEAALSRHTASPDPALPPPPLPGMPLPDLALSGLAVAEVPLWHESGRKVFTEGRAEGERSWPQSSLSLFSPLVVTVSCPPEERHRRLAEIRGWDADRIATVESWQWPEEAKLKASHLALDNGGDEAALVRQAEALLENLSLRRHEEQAALRERLQDIWGRCVCRNGEQQGEKEI